MAAAGDTEPNFATRSQLFSGLFLVATLNGFVGVAVREMESVGWAGSALNLFGISAILWVGLAAGLAILAEDERADALRRGDVAVAFLVLLAALLPTAQASSFGLSLIALWAIATSARDTPLRRAGILFLAITAALLWGRLLLAMFSRPLLDIDAIFVSGLIGAGHEGNVLWSDDRATRLVVAPGCSSMQGMSLALVFWATVNQYFRVPVSWRSLAWCLAALAATIAINVLRIGAMLRWPEHLDAIHNGWGFQVSMWVTLVLVVALCLYGARRDVFAAR